MNQKDVTRIRSTIKKNKVRGRRPQTTHHQKSPRTKTIGLIIPASTPCFDNRYILSVLSGVGQQAAQFKYDLLVSSHPAESREEQNAYRQATAGGWVDGLVIIDTRLADWRLQHLHAHNFPFVALGQSNLNVRFDQVAEDSHAGMKLAVNHLRLLNHKKIALIAPPEKLMLSIRRREAFIQALRQHGLILRPEWILTGERDRLCGKQLMSRLLNQKNRPSAVITSCGHMGIGVMEAIEAHGLQVGTDVSVLGFGGEASPLLTTVQVPIDRATQILTRQLLNRLESHQHTSLPLLKRQITPELVKGQSTGPI